MSPDGRCVAYTSDESGRPEVYVAGLSGHAGKWQISIDGGSEPVWTRDGAELFYRCGHRLMSVDMRRGPSDAGRFRLGQGYGGTDLAHRFGVRGFEVRSLVQGSTVRC